MHISLPQQHANGFVPFDYEAKNGKLRAFNAGISSGHVIGNHVTCPKSESQHKQAQTTSLFHPQYAIEPLCTAKLNMAISRLNSGQSIGQVVFFPAYSIHINSKIHLGHIPDHLKYSGGNTAWSIWVMQATFLPLERVTEQYNCSNDLYSFLVNLQGLENTQALQESLVERLS